VGYKLQVQSERFLSWVCTAARSNVGHSLPRSSHRSSAGAACQAALLPKRSQAFRGRMLSAPCRQRREVCRTPVCKYRAEANEVCAKVPKPFEGVFRESGILRRMLNGLSGDHGADQLGVTQAFRAYVVRNEAERIPEVKFQSPVSATKLARGVVSAASNSGTGRNELETV
jgi:hypothetical protein